MTSTCIAPVLAILDNALALSRAGCHVCADLFAYSDTAEPVQYAIRLWTTARAATIVVNPELRTSAIEVDGHRIACVYMMPADTVVVDVEQLRQVGAL